jgi:cysteine-rich repeat protein
MRTTKRWIVVAWAVWACACGESGAGGEGGEGAGGGSGEGFDRGFGIGDGPGGVDLDADLDAAPFLDGPVGLDAAGGAVDMADPGGGVGGADAASGECQGELECDDGFFCNGIERCERGTCLPAARPPCADDVECTANLCDEDADTCLVQIDDTRCAMGQVCDPKVGCFLAVGCRDDEDCDDGSVCNGGENCIQGTCRPGEPVVCDDALDCTTDTCDDAVGECRALPNHALCAPGELCSLREGCQARPPCDADVDCDDGLFCNGPEVCEVESGNCLAGAAPVVDDGVPCTFDTCDESAGEVTHTPRNARCNDGAFCNGFEVCRPDEGCVAGVPPVLNDGVACTDDRCDDVLDFIEHFPNDAACEDGLFCNGAEVCDPVADCRPGEPVVVNDGVGCTQDACSEVERRVVHTPQAGACDDGLFCNGAEVCDPAAGCLPGVAPVPDDGLDCTDDACDELGDRIVHVGVDGRCDDGAFCNGEEVCDLELGCRPGAAPQVDDAVSCTEDLCDEQADRVVHTPVDARCDDGLACSGFERCDVALDCQPGDAPEVDDGIDCTIDTCDPITGEVTHEPVDAACDDGLFCTGRETCDAQRGCLAGPAPVADDRVGCTQDVCNEETDRIDHLPVSARCDDALFCNGAEVCDVARGCVAGIAPALTDGVNCTVDACDEANDRIVHTTNDAACADGAFCNGAETCDAVRGCLPGVAPVLNDNVACTTDSCDEVNDRVVHAPNNGACADGAFCNGAETCDVVRGCLPGVAPVLNDNVACTTDTCDEANDRVVNTPNNGACSDGAFCNGAETCDAVRGCRPGVAPVLNDNVACTTDTCDEANDRVVNTPNNGACSDGAFCNGAETCDAVRGCRPGVAPVLNDNVACTTDSCDEANDRVVNAPNNAACNDGAFCNGAETCDAVRGCLAGVAPALNDNVACTTDSCDEANDRVVNTPNNAACSDALFCNGAETCDAVRGCLAGVAPVLTDNVACTVDACDEANDRILHTPNNVACSDGAFCNGAETCDAVRGCLAGAAPVVNDNVACTADSCDEVNDRVVNTPNNGACSDGAFCNGAETCDAVRGCRPGVAPVLNDNVACTTDSCDEVNDRVVNAPNNAACSDALFCNGAETCDAVRGCLAGVAPVLNDNVACTVDACDEANDRILHTPNNVACSDGAFCNGAETCDAVRGCLAGAAPVVNDNVACTADSCDEVNDRVVNTPNNALCADANVCDGSEVCDAVAGCREGVALADGTECVVNPRNICLASACAATRCGDRYVDAVANENCDDGNAMNGDGCSSACRTEGGGFLPNYNGRFGANPVVAYSCSFLGVPVVSINTATFVFSVAGNTLSISGLPDCVMTQSPRPGDQNFSATCVVAGGCTETYTLAGVFSDQNNWCGVMTIGFNGAQCGLTNCRDTSINVCGVRQ